MMTPRALAALHADDDIVIAATTSLHDHGNAAGALQMAQTLWQQRPGSAAIAFNFGYLLQRANLHAAAVTPYRHALSLDPSIPMLKSNLAVALRHAGGSLAAERDLIEAALDDTPDDPVAWTNAVNLRLRCGDLDGALRAGARAVSLAPDSPLAHNNAHAVLKEIGNLSDAEHHVREAIALAPDEASYRFNLSLLQLARGQFAAAWPGHELRWHGASELRGVLPALPGERWRGQPLAGKTLLVWGEQGMGDLLQFCRYVPMLAERVHREGGRIVWNSFPQMGALLERSLGEHVDLYDAHTEIRDLPAFDYELPLMSLPMMLGIDARSLATEVPYLRADAAAVAGWRERLAGERRLKVGLAWTGSRTHQRNPFRAVPIEQLAAALAPLQEDVAFYSLQPGAQQDVADACARGLFMTDYSNAWPTLDDTAAFVGALDLVITVCTSVAHLSGALGQDSWVLLDTNPHWVWQQDREDSAFYPTARLYRQQRFAQWEPVLERVAGELGEVAKAK